MSLEDRVLLPDNSLICVIWLQNDHHGALYRYFHTNDFDKAVEWCRTLVLDDNCHCIRLLRNEEFIFDKRFSFEEV